MFRTNTVVLASSLLLLAVNVAAQNFPSKPVRLITPTGPGGSLEGRIYFHLGDDSSFRAEPGTDWPDT